MKKAIARVLLVATLALSAVGASAGSFKIGPVVGVNINKFSADKNVFSADNRCGFTGGVMAKFTVPLIGIGADLSVVYARRSSQMTVDGASTDLTTAAPTVENIHYDYIAVPLHVRYDIGLPIVGKFVAPAIFTGPNFAFRVSKEIVDNYKSKKYDVGWDFGIAVTFIDHLQIAGAYTLNMNKALKYIPQVGGVEGAGINGKTSGWTISAAYLF